LLETSRRKSLSDSWEQALNLRLGVNSPGDEFNPCISPEGCTVFFVRANDIWQSSVEPIVDFNIDGFIDTGDLLNMIDNWGTDNSLCDIGPMPWGNCIVDIKDLEVFIKYWEQ